MQKYLFFILSFASLVGVGLWQHPTSEAAVGSDYVSIPPFVSSGAPPLVMLVMGRDHKLYYEAYNDASDLNDDGKLDIHYTPSIDYYGYFDSNKCYEYNSTNKRFEPRTKTTNKKCVDTADAYWSGDYLNYLTMSRMDTMRKVLYGGYRSTDDGTQTVLQRSFIPQDAHSWGKEYTSETVDGYNIADYTPFTIPSAGLRHLFASTTLTSATSPPLMRYALNNSHRIWDWVAKESPVVDDSIQTTSATYASHPADHTAFEAMVTTYAQPAYLYGTKAWSDYTIRNHASERYSSPTSSNFGAIDGAGNPSGSNYDPYSSGATQQDHYLAIITGKLNIVAGGTYSFGVDGDDAVEVIIDGGTTAQKVIGYYGAHGVSGSYSHNDSVTFAANSVHTIEFRMEEYDGGDQYYLYWNGPDSNNDWKIVPAQKFTDLKISTYSLSTGASTINNLEVRVKVCDPTVGVESNCKQYPSGNYKPIGLLQRHGETKRMYFGLMTGSYANNTSGGVLRREIGDISSEIETTTTGAFKTSTSGVGIIDTLNKFRIYGYDYSSHSYNKNCGWITSGAMEEGQCRDWGNPIAEMMYETLRYFTGKTEATPSFIKNHGNTTYDDDTALNLPFNSTWSDPYVKTTTTLSNGTKVTKGFDSCSKPFMLVLSDINPNFDTDQLPGIDSKFGTGLTSNDLTGFNAKTLADAIAAGEKVSGSKYIGQNGSSFDGICTAKTITGLGDIRGLCPEEPTKQGGYYSAAVAYYGHITDLNAASREQKVTTYAVGLASPLPRIEFKVGPDKKLITLVPFGKSIGSTGSSSLWGYSPTNTIVNFFVETLGDTYGKFRINYEDVEQGADHDMDAIVSYEYQLLDADGKNAASPETATQVKLSLSSDYASGSYIQHLGYIISGTTADGPYLDVKDLDTDDAHDILSPMDTPQPPGTKLTTKSIRTFTPASSTTATAAELLPNPLWYAAKWGAYDEKDLISGPNLQEEWDKDKNGIPDTYFYVTNPLRLEEQLNKSFADILNRASSGTAASVISNTRSGEGALYQSIFFPEKTDTTSSANTVSWVGQLHSLLVDAYGNMREDTYANKRLDVVGPDLNHDGKVYHEDLNGNCKQDDPITIDGVTYNEDMNDNKTFETEYTLDECKASTSPADNPFFSKLDAIIVFNNGKYDRYYDVNGNGVLDPIEKVYNAGATGVSTDNIQYLWNSSNWLNSISDADIVKQRATYISNDKQRYIFTWVDGGTKDGVVTSEEVKDFAWPTSAPSISDLSDVSKFYAYLNLYPSFGNRPAAITSLMSTSSLFQDFLLKQTEREINWVRGLDYVTSNGSPKPLAIGGNDIAGTEMRARRYNGSTWRLGDIAYSTPTAVGAPAEGYHLLYKDASYQEFYSKYQKRRNVIYAGANDGMLHAFNGGFYDSYNKQFCREIASGYDPLDESTSNDTPCASTTSQPELGAELWAYVPYNLLPHLYWLTETTYSHIYYVDQKPRIFDAKIFEPDTAVHINGWGTIMVVGMRFGGANITADLDKTVTTDDATSPTMKSAYLIFDITNPEDKPRLLGEIAMPNMGFSTSYPTMVVLRDGNHDGAYGDYVSAAPEAGENRWLLAFGSGPANASGASDKSVLNVADSSQNGKFYLLDLVQLGRYNKLESLTDSGTSTGVLKEGLYPYLTLSETNSFVSDPVTVDFDLDYNADAVYFGTVSGSAGNWTGKLRRIVIDDRQSPLAWDADSVLIDPGQPITAPPAIAEDDDGKHWIFFGTGRYFVDDDATDVATQSYYGIKEPEATVTTTTSTGTVTKKEKTWDTVERSSGLLNVTNYNVYSGSPAKIDADGTKLTWSNLITQQRYKDGWYINFLDADTTGKKTIQHGERNLGQAALLGGLLSFTTFIPSSDVCVAGGTSYLWALYYQTGTAFYQGILGTISKTYEGETMLLNIPKISLGEGLATSPNIHVGSENGSTVFVQTSTGDIIRIEEDNPLATKSGKTSWKMR
jgi:type IV pilus assembly protein PilY1